MPDDYDYDDPDRERGAVVQEYRKVGLALLAAELLDDAVRIDGLDPLTACRRTMGDLALLLDPQMSFITANAVLGDDDPTRERVRLLVDRALEYVSPDDLAEAQRKYTDQGR